MEVEEEDLNRKENHLVKSQTPHLSRHLNLITTTFKDLHLRITVLQLSLSFRRVLRRKRLIVQDLKVRAALRTSRLLLVTMPMPIRLREEEQMAVSLRD